MIVPLTGKYFLHYMAWQQILRNLILWKLHILKALIKVESAKLLVIGPCKISYITCFYHRLATWCCLRGLLKTTSMLYSTHVHHFLVTTHIFFCSVCCACKLESLGADFHKRVVLPFIFLHINQIQNTSKYWKQDFKCIQSVFLRMCATQSGTYTQ